MNANGHGNGSGRSAAETQPFGRGLPASLVRRMNPSLTREREEARKERRAHAAVAEHRYHEMMATKVLEGIEEVDT